MNFALLCHALSVILSGRSGMDVTIEWENKDGV